MLCSLFLHVYSFEVGLYELLTYSQCVTFSRWRSARPQFGIAGRTPTGEAQHHTAVDRGLTVKRILAILKKGPPNKVSISLSRRHIENFIFSTTLHRQGYIPQHHMLQLLLCPARMLWTGWLTLSVTACSLFRVCPSTTVPSRSSPLLSTGLAFKECLWNMSRTNLCVGTFWQ